jgi:multidrug efflux pump subunit AcrA (membrane-fusion protein)
VGRRFGDRIEIVSGLSAGESIVTSGGFLLEADRRLHRD